MNSNHSSSRKVNIICKLNFHLICSFFRHDQMAFELQLPEWLPSTSFSTGAAASEFWSTAQKGHAGSGDAAVCFSQTVRPYLPAK
jgi:hypothetical protein